MTLPEKLTGYNLYNAGERLLGNTAETEFPTLEAMTTTLSGAGIAGEIESPNIGQFGSMAMTITFRTLSKEAFKLNAPVRQEITLRGNQQSSDKASSAKKNHKLKVMIEGMTKSFKTGTFKTTGGTADTQVTIEVEYLKVEVDGEVLLELDKLNYIYFVDGVDYLEEIRNNM